ARRGRNVAPIDYQVVERDVVPFHAPAPRRRVGRRAEDGEVIQLRIAHVPAPRPLQLSQYLLQAHDRHGFGVAAPAQATGDERVGQLELARVHLLERQPLAGTRDVVPVAPLLVLDWIDGARALLRRERGEQRRRGLGHALRRLRFERYRHGPLRGPCSLIGQIAVLAVLAVLTMLAMLAVLARRMVAMLRPPFEAAQLAHGFPPFLGFAAGSYYHSPAHMLLPAPPYAPIACSTPLM